MQCQFCDVELPVGQRTASHLVVTEGLDGHAHVHGPLEDKEKVGSLIEAIQMESGTNGHKKLDFPFKEIIFHNRQRIGDMLMFTCAVRDFKLAYPNVKVGVISTAMHVWDNNPYVDRDVQPFYKDGKTLEDIKPEDFLKGATNVLKIGPSRLTNSSNRLDWHFANAYRVSIEEGLKIHIPQGESRGDIWFTKEEYNAPRIESRPYWIIITGGEKGWGCKMYPTVRWQEVVNQNPDILFYQLGSQGDQHVRLTGPNVVDYIGKTEDRNTGLRDLFKLFLNAEGSIGLVSFHMHLSGALKKPCVVVAGAREPVSFTRYAGHQYIANDGTLPCATTACWHCAPEACTNPVTVNGEWMPKCVDMITSEEVTRNLRRYYEGGRLKLNQISEKPKVNIGKHSIQIKPEKVKVDKIEKPVETLPDPNVNTYGLSFGKGAITDKDWEYIKAVIKKNNVKSVLEFGTGLSTLLLSDLGLDKLVSYDEKPEWIAKVKGIKPDIDVRSWDGLKIESDEKFDLGFVDGPAGDLARRYSTEIASKLCKYVIVHDAGREWALKYQAEYLAPSFEGPGHGGHWCQLWTRKGEAPVMKTKKKFIKVVSTARGWGGCARSITTILKMLLDEGHRVEFIPFRNRVASIEFKELMKYQLQEVKVTENYDSIKEKCDVLFMYGDDYIWEFKTPEICDVFSQINADRKVMAVNYRLGSIGTTEWTKGWDKYLFLNSSQQSEFLKIHPESETRVLSPCTDLSKFLIMKPSYEEFFHETQKIRIVRHSSQGDTKFDKEFGKEVEAILACRPDLSIKMMPGPSFVPESPRFTKNHRNTPSVPEFLQIGNLFWYSLPKGYVDAGPRVIIEAMAVGLPILADNWGGAVDRVTPDCGWLCDTKEEMVNIIKNVTLKELKEKGEASKERARTHFNQDAWLKEIL